MYIERENIYNLLYISFRDTLEKGEVSKTKEFIPGAYFDLDSDGKLVGIEIVNTERVLGIAVKDLHLSGELLGVKEAAELAGKDRANFLRDFASRPDFPKPVARVASGQLWLSKDVERYLERHQSGFDVPAERTQDDDAAREELTTRIPYRGWEHREGERYRDYRYEDNEQYEDHEVIDTSQSATDESTELNGEDHEVFRPDRDSSEEQESA